MITAGFLLITAGILLITADYLLRIARGFMYAYIRGILQYVHNDFVVVEAAGVGYKIFTAASTIGAVPAVGQEIKIFTHLYVREDTMNLYGFKTQEELGMFELLISVSGVGPKAALSVISTVSASTFGLAVIGNDAKTLTRAPGIGNKMAQRILLELKDKISKEQLLGGAEEAIASSPGSDEGNRPEAVSALMVLGYSPAEAARAVEAVCLGTEVDGVTVEDIIRLALKRLAR
jgi:Holliday junction DNA helicase RuvA